MKSLSNNYTDYRIYNNLKMSLKHAEKDLLKNKGHKENELMPHVKDCEAIQAEIDHVKDRARDVEDKTRVFGKYVQGNIIDNSDDFVFHRRQIKVVLRLRPQILKDYGIDGLNALVGDIYDDDFHSTLDLCFPWEKSPHLEINMYEQVTKAESGKRSKYLKDREPNPLFR